MSVIEVMFTTWVGWPIYLGFSILVGNAIYERYFDRG
jgi:hypothetical protein